MPKIIKNVREQLIEEAKRQINNNGYSNTTIRSVAKACSLAVGTVYNYFDSKEMLIATFMLEDWQLCLKDVEKVSKKDIKSILNEIYNAITKFSNKYKDLFLDSLASKDASTAYSVRHNMLRTQLSKFIISAIKEGEEREFKANFICESLICWTMEGVEFEKIYKIIEKII